MYFWMHSRNCINKPRQYCSGFGWIVGNLLAFQAKFWAFAAEQWNRPISVYQGADALSATLYEHLTWRLLSCAES
jgi:hypothetical protein